MCAADITMAPSYSRAIDPDMVPGSTLTCGQHHFLRWSTGHRYLHGLHSGCTSYRNQPDPQMKQYHWPRHGSQWQHCAHTNLALGGSIHICIAWDGGGTNHGYLHDLWWYTRNGHHQVLSAANLQQTQPWLPIFPQIMDNNMASGGSISYSHLHGSQGNVMAHIHQHILLPQHSLWYQYWSWT